MSGRPWTQTELDAIRAKYADTKTPLLASELSRSVRSVYMMAMTLGLKKSAAYMEADKASRTERMHASQVSVFKPGNVPWNAGKKMPGHGSPRTYFKPGNMPQNHRPVGSTRTDKDGILMVKVADTRVRATDWKPAHVKVWTDCSGPVPEGCVIVFKPGMKTSVLADITTERLECLTRAQLMQRNSVYTNYPPEIARLHQLRGVLSRQINKRAKENRA